jgi:hypothetical protein
MLSAASVLSLVATIVVVAANIAAVATAAMTPRPYPKPPSWNRARLTRAITMELHTADPSITMSAMKP